MSQLQPEPSTEQGLNSLIIALTDMNSNSETTKYVWSHKELTPAILHGALAWASQQLYPVHENHLNLLKLKRTRLSANIQKMQKHLDEWEEGVAYMQTDSVSFMKGELCRILVQKRALEREIKDLQTELNAVNPTREG